MPAARFAFAPLAALVFLSPRTSSAQNPASAPPLRVIRTTPTANANAHSQITVTFDRPVAGSLDQIVDPKTVLRVEPAIAGRLEWRDPVTVRLTPASTLVAGTSYTVTVANTFRSMDGGALAEPFRFTFRVRGPTLIGGNPVSSDAAYQDATLDQEFDLVYSTAADLAKLSSAAYLEFSAACSGQRIFHLRATGQRPVSDKDEWQVQRAGGDDRDRTLDSLRRVITLVADAPLPHACRGELVAPTEIDETMSRGVSRYAFSTYPDFRISKVECASPQWCPHGTLDIEFTTPVSGAEVLRHVHIAPETKFTVDDTLAQRTTWWIDVTLTPRTGYAIFADTSIRDIYHQSIKGNPAVGYRTTGYAPSVNYMYGHLVVERLGLRSLSVQHVNVDTLVAVIAPVPDSLESYVAATPSWATDSVWTLMMRGATTQRIPVANVMDHASLTNVRLPVSNALRAKAPVLYAVKINGRAAGEDVRTDSPIALVQVTNLGVTARMSMTDGAVWVTGANDGLARSGATVALYDGDGLLRATATTDVRGLVRFPGWNKNSPTGLKPGQHAAPDANLSGDGYVKVTLGDDHAIANINRWDADLSPWQFNVSPAWGDDRVPVAGALFTERGIYRPGERVYVKAIVRDGMLGALQAAPAGDSIKWMFHDRDGAVVRTSFARLTAFGTSSQSLDIPAGAKLGEYNVSTQVKRLGKWRTVGEAEYRVAEYRPPEFLVEMNAEKTSKFPGDAFTALVQARYLFGAPMGRAVVQWSARQSPGYFRPQIPGTTGDWYAGEMHSWWEDDRGDNGDRVFATGTDTLDARGERGLKVTLPEPRKGLPANVTIEATVVDVNRQVVMSSTSTTVHPASFYLAARPTSKDYFWPTGTAQTIEMLAVTPDGQRVPGVSVKGTVVRREWHRVRRERRGVSEVVGDWVSDTVTTCATTTAQAPQNCTFTPKEGGSYTVTLRAVDAKNRPVVTTISRWVTGPGWVPWSDETQFKMDVIPDKQRYSVGDTASVLFASPFTNAEAWVTVEREGIIEQRRIRITSGSTTLKFPITEAYAPNAYVSIVVARGRSAAPGPIDDPGRPTIRVGYAELRVTPEVKRLTVKLALDKADYRPDDSARVRIQVRDAQGHGPRSEVTLWAVDEGVLALTDYKTPDPIDLVYRERGLGVHLASNLTAVAPQVPEGDKGKREAGGGGGAAGADVLRSRFQTTAFFLATVVTDAQGNGTAVAKLPDNLTTFRVMAVAVTAGDRYGKGDTEMLVTRPLLARQALPRFVRPGDQFMAGAVINRRDGTPGPVSVRAQSTGVTLRGDAEKTVTLEPQRGAEARFSFLATRSDTATFRFDVTSDRAGEGDAVRVSLPVRPEYHPRGHTVAGMMMQDTASVELTLPANIDPARSRLTFNLGTSPIAMIRGMGEALHVYPYYCTEQVASSVIPIIALYRAQRAMKTQLLKEDPRADIERAVTMLVRRQNTNGGIGYWKAEDWTTPWLSAHAGMALLDARDVGVKVDSAVLSRIADYVTRELRGEILGEDTPLRNWYVDQRWHHRDQVAAVDFLSRLGRPDIAAENELLRVIPMLTLEDRSRLAIALARHGQMAPAHRLMTPTLAALRLEGRRAEIADSSAPRYYFDSYIRPFAYILTAALAVEPNSPMIGPLVETITMQNGAGARSSRFWNTQDYASAAMALAAFETRARAAGPRVVRVMSGGRPVYVASDASKDSSIALTGLLADAPNAKSLRLSLNAGAGSSAVFYYLTVTEIPLAAPVTPEDAGIKVERWYERYDTGAPVTTVAEGDVVRVRLRISVPTTRQFFVLDDALPAGLEAIDLSLRTASATPGVGVAMKNEPADNEEKSREGQQSESVWHYGYWDSGWWTPFDYRELRDDRVVYSATVLWPGTYTATYLARATTAGTFIKPPAHAEEMYNIGVNGRSDGGTFVVTQRKP